MTKERFLRLFKQLFLYGIIGVFSSGLDAVLFRVLVYTVHLYSVIANVFSVIFGILISFVLNLNFNFKTKDKFLFRFCSFFAVGGFGLLLSTGIIAIGEYYEWHIFLTKIISIFIVAAVQFVLNKLISFRESEKEKK